MYDVCGEYMNTVYGSYIYVGCIWVLYMGVYDACRAYTGTVYGYCMYVECICIVLYYMGSVYICTVYMGIV